MVWRAPEFSGEHDGHLGSRMALGALLGVTFPDAERAQNGWSASDLKLLSDVFVRMIKMIIAPILFSTLVMGIAGHGDDLKKVGRLPWKGEVGKVEDAEGRLLYYLLLEKGYENVSVAVAACTPM